MPDDNIKMTFTLDFATVKQIIALAIKNEQHEIISKLFEGKHDRQIGQDYWS